MYRFAAILLPAFILAACAPAGERDPDVPETMEWSYRDRDTTALFGPPESEGVFVVSCNREAASPAIALTLYREAPENGRGTLVLSRGDTEGRIDMSAVATELGPDFVWRGETAATDSVLDILAAGGGPLNISLDGRDPIALGNAEAAARAVRACR